MEFTNPETNPPTPENITPPPPPYPRTSPSQGVGDRPALSPEQIRELFPLTPNTPAAESMVKEFKKVIARHLADADGKTTPEFLDGLALELWRITRRQG